MGTNIYMRKIPKAERKKELMELIAKQYQQRIDSIKKDVGRCPGESNRSLDEDIDSLRQQIYEEVHIGKCSHGWKFLFAPNPQFYQERKDSVLAFIHSEGWTLMDYTFKIEVQFLDCIIGYSLPQVVNVLGA